MELEACRKIFLGHPLPNGMNREVLVFGKKLTRAKLTEASLNSKKIAVTTVVGGPLNLLVAAYPQQKSR